MPGDTWTVQGAKAQLSEVLRRARAGEPQRIGKTDEACVVISVKIWEVLHPSALGAWLVDSAPLGEDLELPPPQITQGNPVRRRKSLNGQGPARYRCCL